MRGADAQTRRRAALLLISAASALSCRGPVRIAGGGPVPVGAQPLLRIGIVVDRDSAVLSSLGQFRLADASGGAIAVSDARRTWTVRAGEIGRLLFYREGQGTPLDLPAPVVVYPERPADDVLIQGRRYRGDVVVTRGSAGITVVNRVPLELYLQSVVALELGFRAPADREAVMAQAVAARTYAARNRGRREALGFDLYGTDADQAYAGTESEFPEVSDAVQRTAGQILTWRGQPIQALFHSTCGFSTEAAEEVFQNGEPVPYLRAVSDRFGSGDHDFYCAISPRFRWTESWDADSLDDILARTLPLVTGHGTAWSNSSAPTPTGPPQDIGRLTDISVGRTSPAGRVEQLIVTTTTGTYTVNGKIRDVLRPAMDRQLNSTLFQVHEDRSGGRLTRLVVSGAGFGHGVGMCQYGAVGRARAGQDYRQILATYYPGTTLERLY